MTSKLKKKKKRLIDCVSNQNKKYRHSCDLILKSFIFERKVSCQEQESFGLICQLEIL